MNCEYTLESLLRRFYLVFKIYVRFDGFMYILFLATVNIGLLVPNEKDISFVRIVPMPM